MSKEFTPTPVGAWLVIALTAIVGGGFAAYGWTAAPEQWYRSYLVAWLYWMSIAIGSLVLLLLHNLTGGAWGDAIRPVLQAAAGTIPLVALLFMPIALGLDRIYPWAVPDNLLHDEVLRRKQAYLNPQFFMVRAGVYFALWIVLWSLTIWQTRHEVPAEGDTARRIGLLSGQGLVLHTFAITFAAIDWGMSLEPHWFSSIYGVLFAITQGLAALAFAIVIVTAGPRWKLLSQTTLPDQLHDLGKLLLMFVMMWAYMQFVQFLIIWYANVPEEVTWYLHRTRHGWQWVAIALALLQFVVPFFLLLGRQTKRNGIMLAGIAGWLLLMQWIGTVWLVEPAFHSQRLVMPWLDLALTATIGGLWCGMFLWQVRTLNARRFAI